MNIILFDNNRRGALYPLSLTGAVASLRIGIYTGVERWQALGGRQVYVHTVPYLQPLYGDVPAGKNLWIDASVLADKELAKTILSLDENTVLTDSGGLIAGIADGIEGVENLQRFAQIKQVENVRRLQYPWQIFQWNDAMLREDFEIIRERKASAQLPSTSRYVNEADIFMEEGAEVNYSIINASQGPVYIGKGAAVMEGSLIRGPFALCEGAQVKMGAKIYGATTVGPYSVVGGEIKNSVLQGYSNKGHDGYLGDAVIGRWCNLGANTSNSNVKNTGGVVNMWLQEENRFEPVGAKAGVVMGDYSRTAINTAINTGTVTGICCNIFDGGLLPKHIPGFSWGGRSGEKYRLDKALQDIANWKKMKHHALDDAEQAVLKYIFEKS